MTTRKHEDPPEKPEEPKSTTETTAVTVTERAPLAPIFPFAEMERMAAAIAKSGLFGMKTTDQALALMLIAQAEGKHPAIVARDYDIIGGRAAKKAEAMLRDFLSAGGRVKWHQLDDKAADATFEHSGTDIRIKWDMERANQAGLTQKVNRDGSENMWRRYPRQMLRSRCVSEGVRTVWPLATSGMYVPEEIIDMNGASHHQLPEAPKVRHANQVELARLAAIAEQCGWNRVDALGMIVAIAAVSDVEAAQQHLQAGNLAAVQAMILGDEATQAKIIERLRQRAKEDAPAEINAEIPDAEPVVSPIITKEQYDDLWAKITESKELKAATNAFIKTLGYSKYKDIRQLDLPKIVKFAEQWRQEPEA